MSRSNRYFELEVGEGVVHLDNETDTISLTEIHRVSGKPAANRPSRWRELPSAQEICEAATEVLNVRLSDVLQTRSGRGGGTWGHPDIALAYAAYLDPKLQMKLSSVYRRYLSGDAELAVEVIDNNLSDEDRIWIGIRILSKQNESSFRRTVKLAGATNPNHYREVRQALRKGLFGTPNLRVVTGANANEVIKDYMEYEQNMLEAIAMKRMERMMDALARREQLHIPTHGILPLCSMVEAIGKQIGMAVNGVSPRTKIQSISALYGKALIEYQEESL